jgi:preprotein translocase subunit SecF
MNRHQQDLAASAVFGLILCIAIVTVTLLLFGCQTPHQRGGGSEVVAPSIHVPIIRVVQPENPLGASGSTFEEVTTTTAPDGTRVETKRIITTEVGGSQDLAKIIKEAAAAKHTRSILMAVGLLLAAWWMYRHQWPLVAAILAVGAVVAISFGWAWGLAAIGAAAIAAMAYWKSKLIIP